MIVRDAEDTIERTIRSVRPHVAEVCIYLAGESSDGTVSTLERLQRKPGPPIVIEQGEWRDDFSWARTQSFAMVAPEHKWVLWLDSDDELIGGGNLLVAEALAEQHGPLPYVMMLMDGYWDKPTPRARVIHRDRGEWQGQVHEDFREHAVYRGKPALHVPHEIARVKHLRARPVGRYLALAEQAALDTERTPRGLFLLARELCEVNRYEEALSPLLRYLNEGHDAIEGDPNDFRLAAYELGVDIANRIDDPLTQGWLQHEATAYAKRLEARVAAPVAQPTKVGRNEHCWCGSGRKFKKCHGA